MTRLVYLDGEYVAQEEARVSVQDRGFAFGDGVYEVIRASGGELFEADSHLDRLETGLRALRIAPGEGYSRGRTLEIAGRLLRENGLLTGEATVYLQVTRGAAPRTHAFPAGEVPATVYLGAAPFHPPLEERARGISAVTQPDTRWARCHLKTVNLLPNVLAKQAAADAGAWEAILVRDGFVTEGSSTNVFGVLDGELHTSPRSNYILAGITRAVVLGIAEALGLRVHESPLLAAGLWELDELFITGTTTDVLPVIRVDGRPIADGRPGPISRLLQERLAERIGWGAAVALPGAGASVA